GGHEVPQAADLALADAVDTSEALLDSVGVPREVVVDHQMCGLKVQPFAGGVGGDQDVAARVVGELGADLPTSLSRGAAVDGAHSIRVAAQQGGDAACEV